MDRYSLKYTDPSRLTVHSWSHTVQCSFKMSRLKLKKMLKPIILKMRICILLFRISIASLIFSKDLHFLLDLTSNNDDKNLSGNSIHFSCNTGDVAVASVFARLHGNVGNSFSVHPVNPTIGSHLLEIRKNRRRGHTGFQTISRGRRRARL